MTYSTIPEVPASLYCATLYELLFCIAFERVHVTGTARYIMKDNLT